MRKVLKVLAIAVPALLGVLAIVVLTYSPKQRPASAETVERTPARIERGRYLVNHVLDCMHCHSQHDLTRFGAPPVGPAGAGGKCLGKEEGVPGQLCPPNITPDPETGIGAWTDGEIMRALREGVDRDGRALFPMMPYTEYSALSDEDARAVVAYLRTLPPAKNAVPETQIAFPVSFFIKMAPRPLEGPVPDADQADKVAYGRYLTKVSGCAFCHTPIDDKHQPIPGRAFAGGHEHKGPWGVLSAPNLTPHATGLGDRDETAFVSMFRAFAVPPSELPVVTPAQNTVMPWLSRAHMTDADLGAIYAFLKTVPPVENAVERRPLPRMPVREAPPAVGAAVEGTGAPAAP